ncbi:MAG: aldehyde dehydrogenase family protein [Planctomycetota bacterium]|nr:aldehyde dehydrogenase family protein [Planctomycetota bacterium]
MTIAWHQPADLLGGAWIEHPPDGLTSCNPARPHEAVWRGSSSVAHVDRAVESARGAFAEWSAWTHERRAGVLRRFGALAREHEAALADAIRDEVGKVAWDAKAEAQLIAQKVDITLDDSAHAGLARVRGFELALAPGRVGRCWFRPHGVMAVVGPFNFPAHLPNGHIVPALLMGNTVVFKPSDKAPLVGQMLATLLHAALCEAGAPRGVLNLVQGGADVASRIVAHEHIDGVLFTGSWPVGRRIMQANLDRPGRILALEMGGNNAVVVLDDADLARAASEIVRSAFISAGQRCTCARRVIVQRGAADRLIPAICRGASRLIIGDPGASHPVFIGPLISRESRDHVLRQVADLTRAGGSLLVEPRPVESDAGGFFLSPGVMRVERFERDGATAPDGKIRSPGSDVEVFGPFLRVCVVQTEDEAIEQANATDFGLAASIFTRRPDAAARFRERVRAGCVNWNTGTAGASSKLPFGGLGLSGNHRPAGAFALDYCAYPVAGLDDDAPLAPPPGMMFDPAWLEADA